jgi:hypothetical protein
MDSSFIQAIHGVAIGDWTNCFKVCVGWTKSRDSSALRIDIEIPPFVGLVVDFM